LISCFSFKSNTCAFASNEDLQQELDNNIENILDKTDFSSLDDSVYSVPDLNLSFRDFVRTVLNGEQNLEDMFGKQIVSLVAIGKYTYQEVYDMTMLQFTNALHKYADIERYEIHAMLSPYMSSKDGKNQENKHWLAN
jgi:hypothetical protein